MDIMISIRELEQAPRAVRDWLVGSLARQLALLPAADAPAPASPDLAELSPAAAAVLFEQLRNDYLACQLLLEFGRDNAVHEAEPSRLHRLAVADVLHHLRLGSSERFVAALKRISEAWAAIAPAG